MANGVLEVPCHGVTCGGGLLTSDALDDLGDAAQRLFGRHRNAAAKQVMENGSHRAFKAEDQGIVRGLGEETVELEIKLERSAGDLPSGP